MKHIKSEIENAKLYLRKDAPYTAITCIIDVLEHLVEEIEEIKEKDKEKA